jgi:hypothetical protein
MSENISIFTKQIALLFISISVKIGIKAMDYVASVFGLDANGKPLSQQSLNEALQNINQLTDKLTNPEYVEQLKIYVQTITKELDPIITEFIQELFDHIINIIQQNQSRITTIVKDGLLDIPIAGMFISFADIATKIVEIGDSLFVNAANLTESTNKTFNKLKKLNDIPKPPSFTSNQQNGGHKGGKKINKRIFKSIQYFYNTNKL